MNKQMVQKEKTLLVGKLRSIGHWTWGGERACLFTTHLKLT